MLISFYYFEETKPKPIMNNIIYIVGIIAMIWVIYDVWAVNKSLSGGMKIVWTILAIIFSFITAIIYYFVQKK